MVPCRVRISAGGSIARVFFHGGEVHRLRNRGRELNAHSKRYHSNARCGEIVEIISDVPVGAEGIAPNGAGFRD